MISIYTPCNIIAFQENQNFLSSERKVVQFNVNNVWEYHVVFFIFYAVIEEIIIDSRMMANADETAKESKYLGRASSSVDLSF